jgi:hypothetical protein
VADGAEEDAANLWVRVARDSTEGRPRQGHLYEEGWGRARGGLLGGKEMSKMVGTKRKHSDSWWGLGDGGDLRHATEKEWLAHHWIIPR